MVDVDVDQAILDGVQEALSLGLGEIPVVGSFVQAIFGHLWTIAFAARTAEQNKAAMDSLFEAVGKMIQEALAENIADQARAANQDIAQMGQDYYVSVQAFKDDPSIDTQKIVVRFEACKVQLLQMLNLFSQPSYMKHTVLSYGSALAMYTTMLREMIQSAKDCGYSTSEVSDFQRDINDRIDSALDQVMYDALSKLVNEAGEFKYPSLARVPMDLFQLAAGVMNFHTEWHKGVACLMAKPHEDYYDCDAVDTKAHWQLNFRPEVGVEKNYYSMPQVFVSGRPAIHIYTNPEQEIQVARFVFEEDNVEIKFRAYYMVDHDDLDSWEVLVNIGSRLNPQELQFNLNQRQTAIKSFPWVKMYYSDNAWSTDMDRFSTNMRVYYDEYSSFKPENDKSYTITTKAATSATKNYYLIAFEVVPVNAPKLPWV